MGQPVTSTPFACPYDSAAATARTSAPVSPRSARARGDPRRVTVAWPHASTARWENGPLEGTPAAVEISGAGPATASQTGPGRPGAPAGTAEPP